MEKETIIITAGEHSSCLKENKFGGDPKTDCVSVHVGNPETVTVLEGHPKLYTEEEFSKACEHFRKTGQNEAWELAQKIVCPTSNGGYSTEELKDIYDLAWSGDILTQYGYCEAADMAQKWEGKTFRVGDVVKLHWGGEDNRLAVVTWTKPGSELLGIMLDDGNVDDIVKSQCSKTGKTLNVASLLVELNGEEE